MRRSIQYASLETKSAYLSTEFGVNYATRLFGEKEVFNLPRISRGKRKGSLKGLLFWTKCTVGGWHRDGYSGYVCYPGFVRAWVEIDGREIMETKSPSYDKKTSAEAKHAKRIAAQIEKENDEFAEISWAFPGWPRLVDSETNLDNIRRVRNYKL